MSNESIGQFQSRVGLARKSLDFAEILKTYPNPLTADEFYSMEHGSSDDLEYLTSMVIVGEDKQSYINEFGDVSKCYCVGGALIDYYITKNIDACPITNVMDSYPEEKTWRFPQAVQLADSIRLIFNYITDGSEELALGFSVWLAEQIIDANDRRDFDESWSVVEGLYNKGSLDHLFEMYEFELNVGYKVGQDYE